MDFTHGKVLLTGALTDGGAYLYTASACGVHSAPFDRISMALTDLAAHIQEDPGMDDPFTPVAQLTEQAPTTRIASCTADELATARGMIVPFDVPEDQAGVAIKAYATEVGDCLCSLVQMPQEVRDHWLKPLGIDLVGGAIGDASVVTLDRHREGEALVRYLFMPARMRVDVPGDPVLMTAQLLVPESMWERMGLKDQALALLEQEPDEPDAEHVLQEGGHVGLHSFQEMVQQFASISQSAFERRGIGKKHGLPAEHGGPLLGFLAGVMRWMLANHLEARGEMRNPWYALAIAILAKYGFDSGEEIMRFAQSEWDKMDYVQMLTGDPIGTSKPPKPFTRPDGSTGTN